MSFININMYSVRAAHKTTTTVGTKRTKFKNHTQHGDVIQLQQSDVKSAHDY